tara:strand:- start:4098 stop:4748 length:651 start_codon:yes stop_codon:yes gene_type:complete
MNKSSRKRPAPEKKEPINFAQIQAIRQRNAHLLQQQPSYNLPLLLQPPSSPAPPPPQPNNIILNLSDAHDYVPPHFGTTRQTAIQDFKANTYPAPYFPPGRPDSPTYLSGIEMDPELKNAHKEYNKEVRKRPLSPQGEIVISARSNNKAYIQSKKVRAELDDKRKPEIFYVSPFHKSKYDVADGKTKRKKRRKPKTKRKKHTKKRIIKKRKSTRKK